jgi:flagellar assembly protein FliH
MSNTGRVIKADQIAPVGVSSFRPDDALAKIQEEVSHAQQRLNQERASATAEVQALYDRAIQEGYQAGYDKGLQQGLAEQEAAYQNRLKEEVSQRTESAIRSLQSVMDDLSKRPASWAQSWETQAREIVVSVAERVARKVVEADPTTICRTLREILLMLARAPKITVTVHPTDRETLESRPDDWRGVISKSVPLEWVTDAKIARGGCLVQTDHCSIDARIEVQIEKLLREIVGAPIPAATETTSPAGESE